MIPKLEEDILSQLRVLLRLELVELRHIDQFIKSEQGAIDGEFPKQCSCCYQFFDTLKEWRIKTTWKEDKTNRQFELGTAREYRNCNCHSTLVVKLQESRSEGVYADRRRLLFNLCVKNAKLYYSFPTDILRDKIRILFTENAGEIK